MPSAPPVQIEHLVFLRRGMRVLDDVSFTVAANEVFAVVGSNGSGKSTLVRLLLGLDVPAAGTVRLFGHDLAAIDRRALGALRRDVGVVFQGGGLIDSLSVAENVRLPLEGRAWGADDDPEVKIRVRLIELGIDGYRDFFPAELSPGLAKRVQLARALVTSPRLLVCDDPGSGLDDAAERDLEALLGLLARRARLTAVVTTADWRLVRRLATRAAVLEHGRLLALGTPAELEALAAENAALARIVGGARPGDAPATAGSTNADA